MPDNDGDNSHNVKKTTDVHSETTKSPAPNPAPSQQQRDSSAKKPESSHDQNRSDNSSGSARHDAE